MLTTLLPGLATVFVAGLALSLALTPVARRLARRWGLVDSPDGRRKLHGQAVPLAGGPAVFAATVLPLAAAALLPGALGDPLREWSTTLLGLLAGGLVVCVVGIADDLRLLRRRHKVLGQMLAVAVVIGLGVRIERVQLFGWDVELGLLAVPFTAFWLLGAINALNLLDGMDGLLGSVGLIICAAMAVMAGMHDAWWASAVALSLAGALMGFLRSNFPPAKVFMGDSGSMFVGLAVGVLAIQSSLKGPATVALAAPTAVLIVPILDTLAAIIRRKLTGRSIYCTDRGHLHHCLLRQGMSVQGTLVVIAGLCLVAGLGALASLAYKNEALALVAVAAVAGTLLMTRRFGYAELVLVQKRAASLAASLLVSRSGAQQVEVRLEGSADWPELWSRLTESAERLKLVTVSLDVNAPALQEGYHARWHLAGEPDEGPRGDWRTEIPLVACGHVVGRVEMTGRRDGEDFTSKVAAVAHLAQQVEEAVSRLAQHRAHTPALGRPHFNGRTEARSQVV
jgi:UDP-GlcNAc:undecaprenyl-phosphate GlcNAc-1-phosphate transferase